MQKILVILTVSVFLIPAEILFQEVTLAQETTSPEEITEVLFAGEVTSLSPETNELNVQYYDYETDALKEISFTLDNATELENVGALEKIAVGDTVNVEYVKEAAKNIAKRITVEKTEFENTTPSQDKPETPEQKGY